jgi:hypothetical protein
MRNSLVILAATAVLVLLMPQAPAGAAGLFCARHPLACGDDEWNSTVTDLGVEVKDVPLTREAVSQFLDRLKPDSDTRIRNACFGYLTLPSLVRPRTIHFCQVALTIDVRSSETAGSAR